MDKDTIIGLLIGFILGIISTIIVFRLMFGWIPKMPEFPRLYENMEEWEMKELPDGTIKVVVHRRAKEK